ncbi:Hypothetical protein KNT65_gp126 [Escherichia phage EcS1]|uniref:DUF7202 domain-containing protein n=1 Tax=Escherichia phage EcS1 TaxID=2083276 RepID=A0A2Z5ZCI4_9CAUD|nr:Hypothetical protein KNT65_gp126 [Escherichia phage EcS1]BBC78174.1 Hypothetical protein [Escherichia phage EcS1]
MKIHYPHPFDPKNKATIIRQWQEVRKTRCPIISKVQEKEYLGTFIEYNYIDKKKRTQHIEEFCLRVQWI